MGFARLFPYYQDRKDLTGFMKGLFFLAIGTVNKKFNLSEGTWQKLEFSKILMIQKLGFFSKPQFELIGNLLTKVKFNLQ